MESYAILFVTLLISVLRVSADINDILINFTTKWWMTKDNFSSLIKSSFTVTKCATIFIFDDDPGTENIFNEFVSIYPGEYLVNSRKQKGCNNYFMVASTVGESSDGTVDAFRSMTEDPEAELLIVIDEDIGEPILKTEDNYESLGIWNIDIYANANANIAARNGLFSLSDNYLYPRGFTKVSNYDSMKHKNGIVNFEGEILDATTFYIPPFCYLQTTVNESINGDELEVFTLEDKDEVDGVELNLFLLLANRLNFTYRIRKPAGPPRFGRRNGNEWNGGVIGEMTKGKIQMAFGGIWLSLDHYEFTPMTTPWKQLHLHFLVPRPKPHVNFWALTTPLSLEVWAAITIILIVQTIHIYTSAWINPQIPQRFRSFIYTWTELLARLLGNWAPRKMQCLKLQFQLWSFLSVIMVTAYSSSLASKLAGREFDKRIDTLKDFLTANLTWGRQGVKEPFTFFLDLSDPYAKKMPQRYKHETSEEERHEKIMKGNYAILGSRVGSVFFPFDEIREEDLVGYRLMKDSVSEKYISFAVVPWLLESIDMMLLWMFEAGFVEYHLNDVLYRRISWGIYQTQFEYDVNSGQARILELMPLGAGFVVYFIGLFISTIVFYFELRSVQGKRSIREVLLDIKKNREIWEAKELKRKRVLSAYMKLKWKNRFNYLKYN